jgi:hypothetical protein
MNMARVKQIKNSTDFVKHYLDILSQLKYLISNLIFL